jgi:GNAT superfamily N-acetyltransferase
MRIARLAVRRDFDSISEMLADTDFYGAANDLEALLAFDREPTFPYWVVEDAGEIVGVAETNFRSDFGDVAYSQGYSAPHAWIFMIFVRDSSRGLGVGAALMKAVAEEAARLECSMVALRPQASESIEFDRIRFFRRCGLTPLSPAEENSAYAATPIEVLRSLS